MATVGDVGQLPGGVSAAGSGAAVRKTAALRTAAARVCSCSGDTGALVRGDKVGY